MKYFTRISLSFLFCFLLVTLPVRADFLAGIEAYDKQDFPKAFPEFLAGAKAGEDLSQFWVAVMYINGRGVPQNTPKGIKWFHRAADLGLTNAHFQLGLLYYNGKHVAKDHVAAYELFVYAADRKHNDANHYLIKMYLANKSELKGDKATAEAMRRVLRGRPMNTVHPQSKYKAPEDLTDTDNWLIEVATKGNLNAQYYLGVKYDTALGQYQNYGKALHWHGRAATKGHLKSLDWLKKMAKQGNRDAQYNLAKIYVVEQGVPLQITEAVKWYSKAAVQGHNRAQRDLGNIYISGHGFEKDLVTGYMWYFISTWNDYEDEDITLARARKALTPGQVSEAQRRALAWIKAHPTGVLKKPG